MNLRELMQDDGMPPIGVDGLTLDSRVVQTGDLFVGLADDADTRSKHVIEAFSKGAVAAMVVGPVEKATALPIVVAHDLRDRLGDIADRFFGEPSSSFKLLAVTGTNGKSSIAHLGAQALNQLSVSAAMIGTLGSGRPGGLKPAVLTTPDVLTLHSEFAALRACGVEVVHMEASSHGIDQNRLQGARIDAAVFTNLTHDHLDYHGSFEAYGAAKAKLFCRVGLELAIINIDDAFGRALTGKTSAKRVLTYGLESDSADVTATAIQTTPSGSRFELRIHGLSRFAECRLLGEFNLSNLLAVSAWLYDLGHSLDAIVEMLPMLEPPPGRLERVYAPKGAVFIDFAHTPDAVQSVLNTISQHCRGRIITVIGCGGDRDRTKRPVMGRLAAELSDVAIFTSDNPRSEPPLQIVEDMLAGLPLDTDPIVELDRSLAIKKGIDLLAVSDVLVILGKGHERFQEIEGVSHPFSDSEVAEGWIKQGAGRHD